MILNFDGIRNAGELTPHDNVATAWANLANPDRPAVFEFGADASRWDGDGFHFGGLTCARIASVSLPSAVTVEVVSDIDPNVLVSARSSSGTSAARRWPHVIGTVAGTDMFNLFYHTDTSVRKFGLKSRNQKRYDMDGWEGKYAVGIINNDKQVLVQTDAPNAGEWKDTGATGAIGSHVLLLGSGGIDEAAQLQRFLTGKIKALRVYNRVLSDDEIAANRAIDEVRFFGALPTTNAVVRTSVPRVEGNEPSGVYAVDSDGYTFTAPATVTLGADVWTCAGCTLESWDADADDWGEAVAQNGVLSATVAAGDRKRITWLWTHTAGPGALDADAYPRDGLMLQLDGIRNAGLGVAHDGAATAWKDLANISGAATFTHDNGDATSGWTSDGYWFGGRSYATMSSKLNPGSEFTMQVVSDVDTNALILAVTAVSPKLRWSGLVGITETDADAFNIFYQEDATPPVLRAKMGNTDIGNKAGAGNRIKDWAGRYVTAVVEDGVKAAYFQSATPSDADWQAGYKMSKAVGSRQITIGSSNGGGDAYRNRFLIGMVKAVRVYDRVLSDDELAASREIDDARFFGVPPATDAVLVATEIPGVEGVQPCGFYKPAAFPFTAANVGTDAKDYAPAGYTLETWDAANGAWVAESEGEGASWTSPSGTGWASRRLTWKWTVTRGLRTAADYDVGDYVKKDLVLQVDGIRNVGPDKPHSELLPLWRDLSTAGVSGDNVGKFTVGAADTTRGWLANGFYFGGATYTAFTKKLTFTDKATAQVVCDVDLDALRANGDTVKFPHFLSAGSGDYLNLFYHANQSKAQNYHRMCFNPSLAQAFITDWDGRYFTGIRDGLTVKVFQTARSDEGKTDTRKGTTASIGTYPLYLGTGGIGKKDNEAQEIAWRYLTGTINAVRVYDRALTDDELAQNRKVDEARFFGNIPVTNVVVAAGEYDTVAEAPGVYEVQGVWTFSADNAENEDGKRVRLTGYKLEIWDEASGEWVGRTRIRERTYTYTAGESPDKVRLTWDWTPSGTVIIIR